MRVDLLLRCHADAMAWGDGLGRWASRLACGVRGGYSATVTVAAAFFQA